MTSEATAEVGRKCTPRISQLLVAKALGDHTYKHLDRGWPLCSFKSVNDLETGEFCKRLFNHLVLVNSMISRVRGTQDLLPARFTEKSDAQIECWDLIERTAREAFRRYGFEEIRTPIIEKTELFERGVGTETDVNKEMYTFEDRDGDRVSL